MVWLFSSHSSENTRCTITGDHQAPSPPPSAPNICQREQARLLLIARVVSESHEAGFVKRIPLFAWDLRENRG